MPKQAGKHAPKHRKSRADVAANRAPRRVLRNTVMLTSVAAAATAGVVSTGMATTPSTLSTASERLRGPVPDPEPTTDTPSPQALLRASTPLSRSGGRTDAESARKPAEKKAPEHAERQAEDPFSGMDPREIGQALLPEYGFSADQFSCLDALYVSESDWDVHADNPSSSAYGIPQALTESHEMPPGYFTDAEVQIRWGLDYIKDSYGSPCGAWEFKQANNWY